MPKKKKAKKAKKTKKPVSPNKDSDFHQGVATPQKIFHIFYQKTVIRLLLKMFY